MMKKLCQIELLVENIIRLNLCEYPKKLRILVSETILPGLSNIKICVIWQDLPKF